MYTSWHPRSGAGNLHVLLVGEEQDTENLQNLLSSVEGTLPRCREANNVAVAAGELAKQRFDAVVVDQGPEASEAVRALKQAFPSVPVLVVTDADEAGEDAIAAGAQDFLLRGRADGETLVRALRYAGEHHTVTAQLAQASKRLHSNEKFAAQVVAAQEEERSRVARELHDAFGQTLTTLSVHLRSLENNLQDAPREALAERVAQIRKLAAQLIQETAHIGRALRPPALDHTGLNGALTQLADDLRRDDELEVDNVCTMDERELTDLNDETKTTLYRIAQEALNNSVKHSGATRLGIDLRQVSGIVLLELRDDGRGFDPEVRSDGHGLTSMRERAAMIGGNTDIQSSPEGGTLISVSVPVAKRQ